MCNNCQTQEGPEGFWVTDTGEPIDLAACVEAFHVKFGVPASSHPIALSGDMAEFRINRLQEELNEYVEGVEEGNVEKQMDAMVDLVYIAIGTAHIAGHRFNEAFRRVHEANMRKERALRAEQSRHGSIYDVVKPEGWTPCDLTDLCGGPQ